MQLYGLRGAPMGSGLVEAGDGLVSWPSQHRSAWLESVTVGKETAPIPR